MRGFLLTFLFCHLSQGAPQISFAKGTISAIPDGEHPPVSETLEILEQENCVVQKGTRRLVLDPKCDFMRGLYRYAFNEKKSENQRVLFIEFTAFRTVQGFGFLSAAPLELSSQ